MLTKLYAQAQSFLASREGVTAIEYAVIAAAIAGVVFAVFSGDGDGSLQDTLETALENVGTAVNTATGGE